MKRDTTSALNMYLADDDATRALGRELATACRGPVRIHLQGELGTGKTTLVRALLRARGFSGPVRSPTYTLIEPYELQPWPVYHLDLYRLADPEELEYLGLRDLEAREAIVLIEWPERGAGALPMPDLEVSLSYEGRGRRAALRARSEIGEAVLGALRERDRFRDNA